MNTTDNEERIQNHSSKLEMLIKHQIKRTFDGLENENFNNELNMLRTVESQYFNLRATALLVKEFPNLRNFPEIKEDLQHLVFVIDVFLDFQSVAYNLTR